MLEIKIIVQVKIDEPNFLQNITAIWFFNAIKLEHVDNEYSKGIYGNIGLHWPHLLVAHLTESYNLVFKLIILH